MLYYMTDVSETLQWKFCCITTELY